MIFKGSEQSEIPLEEKLEYILTDLLPLVGHEYKTNRIVIQEFSDSDDDY